ncbi:MAG: hypothetical protein Q9169_008165, partial [Polycauliona sp. 2 TL-2023]
LQRTHSWVASRRATRSTGTVSSRMRLLNTRTLQFVEVIGPESTKYAILSHTWDKGEVTFQDLYNPESKHFKGYAKIKGCCAQALDDGYNWVWIDTCCIDKKSSAELSEAINSMYNWYSRATMCYVYLSDVSRTGVEETDCRAVSQSRWFSRGWTLQELLASRDMLLFDQHWQFLGSEVRYASDIALATGIDEKYIKGPRLVRTASVAARMSWASSRQTSRPEDEAYCLMGLFDVVMPLLYGEGSLKAFRRLQEEIAKNSEDESLFAWHDSESRMHTGLFAPDPAAFRGCGEIEPVLDRRFPRQPYSITNRGLSMDATYQHFKLSDLHGNSRIFNLSEFGNMKDSGCLLLPLQCARMGHRAHSEKDPGSLTSLITIILVSKPEGPDGTYIRFLPTEVMVYDKYYRPNIAHHRESIFIQASPGSGLYRSILGEDVVTVIDLSPNIIASLASAGRCQWYTTPPGYISKAIHNVKEGSRTIYFSGWTGFAVLQFQVPRTYYVIIRHVWSVTGVKTVLLTLHDNFLELQDVVDFCYAQQNFLDVVPDGSAERSLQVDDVHHIDITRDDLFKKYELELFDGAPSEQMQRFEPTDEKLEPEHGRNSDEESVIPDESRVACIDTTVEYHDDSAHLHGQKTQLGDGKRDTSGESQPRPFFSRVSKHLGKKLSHRF